MTKQEALELAQYLDYYGYWGILDSETRKEMMVHGVIGSTRDFESRSPGSSPGGLAFTVAGKVTMK